VTPDASSDPVVRRVTDLVTSTEVYDGAIVAAAQEALESHGLTHAEDVSICLADGGPWRRTPCGRWLAARMLDVRGDPAAAGVWSAVIEAGAGPEHEARLARARLRGDAGALDAAYADLREAVRRVGEASFLQRAARLYRRLRRQQAPPATRRIRLAVVASSTTDLLVPLLELLAFRDGIATETYVGPYGNVRQEILDPGSGLYAFHPDVVLIVVHWRDAQLPAFAADAEACVAEVVDGTRTLWETLLSRHPCTVIQHGFDLPPDDAYGNLGSVLPGGRAAMLRAANRRMMDAAPPAVAVLDLERVAGDVGHARWADAGYWHTAKQHPAPSALPPLVERQVALLRAAVGLTRKVLVLDLDNTLWHGIIGEDGLDGIQVGPPSAAGEAHAALQQYARDVKERGVLLAVCSKNNEADAKAPFEHHDGMLLRLDDFAIFRANWLDKVDNLRDIARVLNLGLDSFVFLDDNPVERARIRAALPEVAVPEVGPDPADLVGALERGRYFEAWSLSEEDRQRTESYRTNVQREELRATAGSLEEFLVGLHMTAETGPFTDQVLARVVQLLGKTNQFNLTTRRHNEQRVRQMMASDRWWTQYFKLCDRFGDHGLIGVMIAAAADGDPATWELDTWLMSCRVIGRQMEDCMLDTVVEAARAAGASRLMGRYVPTPKNALVRDLYQRMGFREVAREDSGAIRSELPLADVTAPRCTCIARASSVPTA
jgi:FkbH-like protein